MSFWQGKNVLVTGANGFVGSNLVKVLILNDANVYTISNKPLSDLNLAVLGKLSKHIREHAAISVESYKLLDKYVKEKKIDIIYHLAAQSLVEVGQESPIRTFEVNIRGTWNVLESARRNGVSKVLIASTSHVYGSNKLLPFREEYFPQPSRPYETSKACADLLAQSFADTYKLSVEIPRFVNIYGPGDLNFSRVTPRVMRSIILGDKPKIWDSGSVRDFLFIDDAASAYLVLAEKCLPAGSRNRVFNFGTGKPISIIQWVKKIMKISDTKLSDLQIEPMPDQRSKEVLAQYVSIRKAKKVLGWEPKTTLDDGLKKTFDWYKKHQHLFAK